MVVAAWNEKRKEGKKEERKKKRNESIYIIYNTPVRKGVRPT